jgi:hypothetical protein
MLNRRSFVKSVGAFAGAALLPSIRLLEVAPRPIDLQQFCEVVGSRYKIDAPFFQNGLTYATDARIAVRTSTVEAAPVGEAVRLPDMPQVFGTFTAASEMWRPLPRRNFVMPKETRFAQGCPMCGGQGRIGNGIIECATCQGIGEDLGAYEDICEPNKKPCLSCNGCGRTGGEACDYCDGQGSTRRPTLQPIGRALFAGSYFRKIQTLGDVEFIECAPRASVLMPIKFRFAGGDGLLMPVING